MKKFFYLLFAAVILGGCASINPYKKAEINVENSKRLRVGMTKTQVLSIMGDPEKNESFNRPDIWYYYFEPNWIDGLVNADECFLLVFKDGKLIGWGNRFYSRYRLESEKRIPEVKIPDNEPQNKAKK